MTEHYQQFLKDDAFGSDSDAACYTGLSQVYLRKLRLTGDGPKYVKLGRCVRHKRAWLDEWAKDHERTSTTEPA